MQSEWEGYMSVQVLTIHAEYSRMEKGKDSRLVVQSRERAGSCMWMQSICNWQKRLDSRLVLQSGEQAGSCMWMQSRVVKKAGHYADIAE